LSNLAETSKSALPEPDGQQKPISAASLEKQIDILLEVFYAKRIGKLQKLSLKEKLKRKNPYLFRAIGVADVNGIVEELLDAHISSSDETVFGNEFFEPLAKWVAEEAFSDQPGVTVQVGSAEGCDILKSDKLQNQAIAVKSGTKVFNSQSRNRQISEFKKIRNIMAKDKKAFLAIVGYCYGKKKQKGEYDFTEMAGQDFWEHLTGDKEFYLRIIELMATKPTEHGPKFLVEYNMAKNRFAKDFLETYCLEDGSIDWKKLAISVSGKPVKATPAAKIKPPKQSKKQASPKKASQADK
jgi:hypothetical protein